MVDLDYMCKLSKFQEGKKYRIPTWLEGYYIYLENGQFKIEDGTPVMIDGWKNYIDDFVGCD